jgi:hypothetical protein
VLRKPLSPARQATCQVLKGRVVINVGRQVTPDHLCVTLEKRLERVRIAFEDARHEVLVGQHTVAPCHAKRAPLLYMTPVLAVKFIWLANWLARISQVAQGGTPQKCRAT